MRYERPPTGPSQASRYLFEWLNKVDGPGRRNRRGQFLSCPRCGNRYFYYEQDERCTCKCGFIFERRNDGRRKRS